MIKKNLAKKIEHIFNYFYKNIKNYNIHFVKNRLYGKNYKKNFSIDSKKDLERVKKMYQNLNNFYTPTEKIIKTFKMKSEANLNWHICGVKQKILFRYNKKPSAEKNYNIIGKYNRVFINVKL